MLDAKLGGIIKEKLDIPCVFSSGVQELARGVRSQLQGLIASLAGADLTPMSLGLSHSLSRYKLKFSPDKVCGVFWFGVFWFVCVVFLFGVVWVLCGAPSCPQN